MQRDESVAVDKNEEGAQVLPDLSVAFDISDHA